MARELLLERVTANMKSARVKRGMTQADVAERLGVTRQTFITYEANPQTVPFGTFVSMAEIYGCEVSYFFGE